MAGLAALHRMDIGVLGLEIIVLIAVVVSLGPVWRAWLNLWGLLLGAIIVFGMLFPLRSIGARTGSVILISPPLPPWPW